MAYRVFLFLHRWTSIAAAALIIVCGLTGSTLVFREDLDRRLNADMLTVVPQGKTLSVDDLAAKVEAALPGGRVNSVIPSADPTRAWNFMLGRRSGPGTEGPPGRDRFSPNVVHVDPYTGAITGSRTRGEVTLDRKGFVPLVHGIHHDLLLEAPGHWVVAGIGAVWMLLSLVGVYLALKQAGGLRAAFRINTAGTVKRVFLDMHRSFGMASVLVVVIVCVSGIYLNLRPEVAAIVSAFSPVSAAPERALPANPVRDPAVGFAGAMAAAVAAAPGTRAQSVSAVRPKGVYRVRLAGPGDVNARGDRFAYVSMQDARIVQMRNVARGGSAGDVFIGWQFPLHTGEAFGWPGRLAIFAVGLLPLLFSVTGIYLWLARSPFSRRKPRRRPATLPAASDSAIPIERKQGGVR